MSLDKDSLCLLLIGVISALSVTALILHVPVAEVEAVAGLTIPGLFAVIKGSGQ